MGWFTKAKQAKAVVVDGVLPAPGRLNFYPGPVFEAQRLPSPGSQGYVYDVLGLAEFNYIGAGVMNKSSIRACSAPAGVQYLAVPLNGIGGLIPGQMILQPLVPSEEFGASA